MKAQSKPSSFSARRCSPSARMAQAMVLTQWTCTTTRCGISACTVVSIEGRRPVPFRSVRTKAVQDSQAGSFFASAARMAAWSSGTKMSRAAASFSQVPDALIHMTPPSFSDVLPPAACTSSGSLPTRAESARRRSSSTIGRHPSRNRVGGRALRGRGPPRRPAARGGLRSRHCGRPPRHARHCRRCRGCAAGLPMRRAASR